MDNNVTMLGKGSMIATRAVGGCAKAIGSQKIGDDLYIVVKNTLSVQAQVGLLLLGFGCTYAGVLLGTYLEEKSRKERA